MSCYICSIPLQHPEETESLKTGPELCGGAAGA